MSLLCAKVYRYVPVPSVRTTSNGPLTRSNCLLLALRTPLRFTLTSVIQSSRTFSTPIAALDADVLSIENSKSDAKLLKVFIDEAYPRHIGPGVYDIHSPRVPPEEEFKQRIKEMLQ